MADALNFLDAIDGGAVRQAADEHVIAAALLVERAGPAVAGRLHYHHATAAWSSRERGQFLRMLLCFRGIDPHALFRVEYYPYRCCWLLLQEHAEDRPAAPFEQADEAFYVQTMTEFRRAARSAFAAAAARSLHFASHGCAYQLPPKLQEATTFDLAKQLGGKPLADSAVHFTAEGGWQSAPSEN